ncbi:MAG: hypothetical protein KTR21_14355 [Rhodobacteraceae bacterium]|nr:hypothetical protein [Paracoccaceae bacterium]
MKKRQKIVSFCGSPEPALLDSYIQYRFGKPGKIELITPEQKYGWPPLQLRRRRGSDSEYFEVSFIIQNYHYALTNYRRLVAKPGGQSTAPESFDSLRVDDLDKSSPDGDWVFFDQCERLETPVNLSRISKITGIEIEDFLF